MLRSGADATAIADLDKHHTHIHGEVRARPDATGNPGRVADPALCQLDALRASRRTDGRPPIYASVRPGAPPWQWGHLRSAASAALDP
jgi:hypothetical protein